MSKIPNKLLGISSFASSHAAIKNSNGAKKGTKTCRARKSNTLLLLSPTRVVKSYSSEPSYCNKSAARRGKYSSRKLPKDVHHILITTLLVQ